MYFTSYREDYPCIKSHVYIPRRCIRHTHQHEDYHPHYNGNHGDNRYIWQLLWVLAVFRSYIYLDLVWVLFRRLGKLLICASATIRCSYKKKSRKVRLGLRGLIGSIVGLSCGVLSRIDVSYTREVIDLFKFLICLLYTSDAADE